MALIRRRAVAAAEGQSSRNTFTVAASVPSGDRSVAWHQSMNSDHSARYADATMLTS